MREDQFIKLSQAGENAQIEYKTCYEQISDSLYETVCSFLSSADFPAYNLRTIQIRRKCGRRRTHCADCPFLNEYKQSKKSKCEH